MDAMKSTEAGEWNESQGTLEEANASFHRTQAWKLWWKLVEVEASTSTNSGSFRLISWKQRLLA